MAAYLLDANALIDWLGGVHSVVSLFDELAAGQDRLVLSPISVAEVYSGLSEADRHTVDRRISGMEYWDISLSTAKLAGRLRHDYARRGTQLAVTDTLLAALTLQRNATLITGNVRAFPMPEISLLPLPPR